ncbi:MAG: hypothetical protein V7L22_10695 [Nostoc sp.]
MIVRFFVVEPTRIIVRISAIVAANWSSAIAYLKQNNRYELPYLL